MKRSIRLAVLAFALVAATGTALAAEPGSTSAAAVAATPEANLRLSYYTRTIGTDGVQRENRYNTLMYRRAGLVWSERELPAALRESLKHGHAEAHGPHAGHAHNEAQGAPLLVRRDASGTQSVQVVLRETRRVIEVDRAHHGNVGYGGSWEAVYWLLDPAGLSRMEKVGTAKAGVQRYRTQQGEQTMLIDWDVARQYPRRLERSDAHGLNYQLLTVSAVAAPAKDPWLALDGYGRGDYSDLLD